MLSQGISKLVEELEGELLIEGLLQPRLHLLNEEGGFRISFSGKVQVDELQIELVQLHVDSLAIFFFNPLACYGVLLEFKFAEDHACMFKRVNCSLVILCRLVGVS